MPVIRLLSGRDHHTTVDHNPNSDEGRPDQRGGRSKRADHASDRRRKRRHIVRSGTPTV